VLWQAGPPVTNWGEGVHRAIYPFLVVPS
jgi:hypothetical protein